jgi:cell division protein ZapA (FtsZ GTPase activity inhibitor)
MMNTPTIKKVIIFGEQYSLVTNESEHALLQASSLVDMTMKEIAIHATADINAKKVAILAAVRIASILLHMQAESDRLKQQETLLEAKIDQALALK